MTRYRRIKDKMIDEDMFLSEEDELLVEESFKQEKKGTLISLEDLEKERKKSTKKSITGQQ